MRLVPLSLAFAGLMLSAAPVLAQQGGIPDDERAKIETVIQDYLDKNPGVVLQALEKNQENQRVEMERQFVDKFATAKDEILKEKHPTVGPETADVTIFEFYDYNCGYCKKAFADVAKIVEEDKNVRFVFIEMPILSESSIEAARWALAIDQQGKFFEYHSALMNHGGMKDKATLEKYASQVGVDIKKATADADSRAVLETIEKNLALARSLGISGTPAFVIGNQLTPGYMGLEGMKAAIAEARKNGKTE
ncbi:MAG: DsbA family protein [Alphaproteobacteria bacterium]|nr:DsbA family protein [Alphaproteobacteria bacterium]